MKKYICYEGYVRSADGDVHHIAASRLPDLYKVNPAECIFVGMNDEREKLRGYTQEHLNTMIKLSPRNDGDYTLSGRS